MSARLYRVKYLNRWNETHVFRDGVPADVADGLLYRFATGGWGVTEWRRVWIETLDGRLVDYIERPAFV